MGGVISGSMRLVELGKNEIRIGWKSLVRLGLFEVNIEGYGMLAI